MAAMKNLSKYSTWRLVLWAATVLGRIGSLQAQRTLVDFANLRTQTAAARQAAAAGFAQSVARFGVLLTRDEILQQYDLYNANAGRDRATHDVLSSILDALERKTAIAGA